MMFCGEWMLNSHKIKHDKMYNDTEELEQHIFSFASKAGYEKWIEYDDDLQRYFPTLAMEEAMQKFKDKYKEKLFDF